MTTTDCSPGNPSNPDRRDVLGPVPRILVVDDEQAMLDTYRNVLGPREEDGDRLRELRHLQNRLFDGGSGLPARPSRYRMTRCLQGDEAVQAVRLSEENADPYAVAFIDVRMPPGPDGIITAQIIRSIAPDVNIVLVTAYADTDPLDFADRIPPLDKLFYVQKPFHAREMRQFAAALCAKWLSERHLSATYELMNARARSTANHLERKKEELTVEKARRLEAEGALRSTKTLLERTFLSLHDAVFVLDSDCSAVLMTNPAGARISGYRQESILGTDPARLFDAPSSFAVIRNHLPESFRTRDDVVRGESILRRADGMQIYIEYALTEITNSAGQRSAVVMIVRDTTEARTLRRAVLEAEDRERQRIGQELHDDVGQLLTGIAFKSSALAHQLRKSDRTLGEDAREITALVDRAKNKVRDLVRGIAPLRISAYGLRSAIEELAENAAQLFGIRVEIDAGGETIFEDPSVRHHIYRIVQEAITNAVQHGAAENVSITLAEDDARYVVTVRDDGRSISDDPEREGGSGLRLMRDRARLIGATLEIGPDPQGGTLVVCSLRVRPAESEYGA